MKELLCLSAVAVLLTTGCGSLKAPNHPAGLPVCYHNAQYRLTFFLPASWQGHSVLSQQWEGSSYVPAKDTTEVTGRGPLLVLRHPRWRADAPCQDIPILVYTRRQWEAGAEEKSFPYAGGVIDEMWHNRNYVFAIYSRYNWAGLEGWNEVAKIVEQNCAANKMPHLPRTYGSALNFAPNESPEPPAAGPSVWEEVRAAHAQNCLCAGMKGHCEMGCLPPCFR